MNIPEHSQLGKASTYVDQYSPDLLYPLSRSTQRQSIGVGDKPVFVGADLWTAYELSWLNLRGKPQIAMARMVVPCESTHLVESKSLKLYLNSFNNTRFADAQAVQACLQRDLSQAVWQNGPMLSGVGVTLVLPEQFDREPIHELDGLSLDRLDIDCDRYQPAPDLLQCADHENPVTETLTSNLLKSNCLVTGQPDWGSVRISYSGPQIEQGGLLQYLVSFRNHNEFHEHCVERIFMDLWTHCKPTRLSVYARYTRRGGVDINPWRTSHPGVVPASVRTARQ
ncbi:MAG: NADPH-dependent 7-cyano-7-deazaguanine reductase QueF [Betaproteobacteria bacterium]|nr:NADPH-dependent 7-cyano-7-deazaguanine reductase QueF [Betaproteobacteria bacterium]